MKLRSSFQVFRETKDENARPKRTGAHFRIPSLRGNSSTLNLNDGTDTNGANGEKSEAIETRTRKPMQDFWQKTKATGANLKAKSAKFERRIPRKKPKVVKTSSKRSSQVRVRTYDIDNDVFDKIMESEKQVQRQASAAFLDKQRERASVKKLSPGVSALSSQSQAEMDRKILTASDVETMFAGAPCFSVKEVDGKYKAEVSFPGEMSNPLSKLPTDYADLGHASFAASTLCRRSTLRREKIPSSPGAETIRPESEVEEVPSMLSATGLDPGAVGFRHYLQLPLSSTTPAIDEPTLLKKREQLKLDAEWLGLRELNIEILIDRLTEIGELHEGIKQQQWESPEPWNKDKLEEMGEHLFENLLSADLGTRGAGAESVSLKAQISALQKALNTKDLWRDFSVEEWRIRVGQLLWAPEDFEDGQEESSKQYSERDVLLLQITLAAELLIRLYAMEALSSSFPPVVSAEDATSLAEQRSTKIKWDLVLADRFLDNLNISAGKPPGSEMGTKTNRSSLLSAITFFSAKETVEEIEDSVKPVLSAKNEAEQLAGLVHFAEAIQWPHASDVKTELQSKLSRARERPVSTAASLYATPLSSPKFQNSPGSRSSFFGFGDQRKTPGLSRTTTAQSISLWPARNIAGNVESFEVGGWLSRSWLSGFVMPGEPAFHFLISALLENSPRALTALGEQANLYGGFIYDGRSYWSKSSVVGRVLAASKGASECMGWISAAASPSECEDGWINLDVKEASSANSSKPRIKDTEAVAKDSQPLPNDESSSVQAGDFLKPTDGPLVIGNEVRFDGLTFTPTGKPDSEEETAPSTANLTFRSPINSKPNAVSVSLTYDVHFISSHPCHPMPPARPRTLSRPEISSRALSFEIHKDEPSPSTGDGQTASKSNPQTPTAASAANLKSTGGGKKDSKANSRSSSPKLSDSVKKELPCLPAHPLHIEYQFNVVPVATLLSMAPETRPRALSSPTEKTPTDAAATVSSATATEAVEEREKDVAVLDCRGAGEDGEVLARAWCAKVGEDAVIGKTGRTCLGCCVREARACGVAVVIRI